jgi:hypothetical protein
VLRIPHGLLRQRLGLPSLPLRLTVSQKYERWSAVRNHAWSSTPEYSGAQP